ncbi:transposable element Tcb2 transposase [Trichonephila clavipes]|nr:transposable element Tcb2 transposase [Trichonephila clavipes]
MEASPYPPPGDAPSRGYRLPRGYKTGNESLFECAESLTKKELRCWDQWIREISFTRRPGSRCPQQTSCREDHHIARNVYVQSTTSSVTIQAQVVLSVETRSSLSSDDNRVRVWRPCGERHNPAFVLHQHIAPTAGTM